MAKISITSSFLSSLSVLSKKDQNRVLNTIKKVMKDNITAGQRVHKVSEFISISSGMDLRIICTQLNDNFILNYVDHHNNAYFWANNHKLILDETLSLMEIVPDNIQAKKLTIQNISKPIITSNTYGNKIKQMLMNREISGLLLEEIGLLESEESMIEFIEKLSPSLQETILNLVTNPNATINPFNSSSNVIVINDDNELEEALKYPRDNWRLFLHPIQKDIINQSHLNKTVIVGGPGTGKTVALVHRAVNLYDDNKKVLLITKTEDLARIILALINKLKSSHKIIVAYFVEASEKHDLIASSKFAKLVKKEYSPPYKIRLFSDKEWRGISNSFKIDHILFDEAQDIHETREMRWLEELINMHDIGITLSIDINQTVYSQYPDNILNLLYDSKVKIKTLNYSYRSTREIIKYAQQISSSAKQLFERETLQHIKSNPSIDCSPNDMYYINHYENCLKNPRYVTKHKKNSKKSNKDKKSKYIFYIKKQLEKHKKALSQKQIQLAENLNYECTKKRNMIEAMPIFSGYPTFYGLSGPPVRVISSSERILEKTITKYISDLQKTYKNEDIIILVPNETIIEKIRDSLKNSAISTFKRAKGCEWFAGIILVTSALLPIKNTLSKNEVSLNAVNSLYVAITRCREKAIIISIEVPNSFNIA